MIRKRFLLLALLASCGTSKYWAFDQIPTGNDVYQSTKITCSAKNSMRGIDMEVLKTAENIRIFLNVHSLPLSPLSDAPKTAHVALRAGETNLSCDAYLFEGGQRLLLPDETTALLLEALQDNQDIAVSIEGYQSLIRAEGFSQEFKKLLNPFPYPPLIQPPF